MRKMPRQRPKQTNKNELWDEVEEVLEGYVIKRPLDTSNTSFGQDDTIPIKQEIKNEPLDEDSVDIENLSFEKDPMIIDDGQNDPTKMIADQRKIVRNFCCDKCEKSFVSQSKLTRHFNGVHEGKRDYKCETCGKSFSQAGNLKFHIQKKHEGHNFCQKITSQSKYQSYS